MRSTWTDSRLDEFKDQVNASLGELGQRVDHQSNRIDRLQHTILIVDTLHQFVHDAHPGRAH